MFVTCFIISSVFAAIQSVTAPTVLYTRSPPVAAVSPGNLKSFTSTIPFFLSTLSANILISCDSIIFLRRRFGVEPTGY